MFFKKTAFVSMVFCIFTFSGCTPAEQIKPEAVTPISSSNSQIAAETPEIKTDDCSVETDFAVPLKFCEMSKERVRDSLQWQDSEVQTRQKYIVLTRTGYWEGEKTYSQLIIQDRTTAKFFISNRPVRDAVLTEDGSAIILSPIFMLDSEKEKTKLTSLGKLFKIEPKEIAKFFSSEGESGLDSFSVLAKVSLPDLEVKYLPYLGGEKIAASKNEIIFSQYSLLPNWVECFNSMTAEGENCKNLKLSVVEIAEQDYHQLNQSEVANLEKLENLRKTQKFPLYAENDENILKKLLKALDL